MAALDASQCPPNLAAGFAGQYRGLWVLLRSQLSPSAQFAARATALTPQPVECEMGCSKAQPSGSSLTTQGIPEMELEEDLLGDVLSRRSLQ